MKLSSNYLGVLCRIYSLTINMSIVSKFHSIIREILLIKIERFIKLGIVKAKVFQDNYTDIIELTFHKQSNNNNIIKMQRY